MLTTLPSSNSLVSSPEVPDVAPRVLGVPVERVLDHLVALGDDVVHDRGGDAEDRLRPVGDGDLDALLGSLAVGLAVDPPAPRRHRPVGVVDHARRSPPGRGWRARCPAGAEEPSRPSPPRLRSGRCRPAPRPRRRQRGRGARGRERRASGSAWAQSSSPGPSWSPGPSSSVSWPMTRKSASRLTSTWVPSASRTSTL